MEEPLILDRYRPLAHLGSGGHGSVVLAFDTKMARRVAIKRLPLPRSRSGSIVPRTGLAEARTAALLNHPGIVTVHEWDTDSDEAFIVMEDIDGASMAELLDASAEPLDADEAAAVLEAVAGAVGFAHANGVLHLDLKPGNILLTRDARVKVADFGVSALTDASGRAMGTAGTLGYMPPEQLRGEELDEQTDVWALAAVMYELLTKANPFDAETAEGSLFKIEVAEVPLPSEFETWLPESIDDVLLQALAPDTAERPDSVASFAAALAPHLGDPVAGRALLEQRLEDAFGEEAASLEYPGVGLWDRLGRQGPTLARLASALVAGWLGWTGASVVAGQGAALAAAALVGLAALLAPDLGFALASGAFSLGLGMGVGWPAGVVAFGAFALVWLSARRGGSKDAFVPAVGPLLGAARAALAAPLVVGFALPPFRAALVSLFAAVALIVTAAATGGAPPFLAPGWRWLTTPLSAGVSAEQFLRALSDPGLLAVPVSWALAAAASSLGSRRASRAGAIFGTAAGIAVLVLGYAGWGVAARSPFTLSPIDVGAAAVAIAVTIALGPPARAEEE